MHNYYTTEGKEKIVSTHSEVYPTFNNAQRQDKDMNFSPNKTNDGKATKGRQHPSLPQKYKVVLSFKNDIMQK